MMYGPGGVRLVPNPKAVYLGHLGLGSFILDPGALAASAANFGAWLFPQAPVVAKPGIPVGWETGNIATSEIDRIVNEQMVGQNALNAGRVDTTVGSELGGSMYQAGETVKDALPWGILAVAGIGLATLAVLR